MDIPKLGGIRAEAASLHHSSWQCQTLNPLRKARDWTHILMDTSPVHYHWATTGIPGSSFQYQRLSVVPGEPYLLRTLGVTWFEFHTIRLFYLLFFFSLSSPVSSFFLPSSLPFFPVISLTCFYFLFSSFPQFSSFSVFLPFMPLCPTIIWPLTRTNVFLFTHSLIFVSRFLGSAHFN